MVSLTSYSGSGNGSHSSSSPVDSVVNNASWERIREPPLRPPLLMMLRRLFLRYRLRPRSVSKEYPRIHRPDPRLPVSARGRDRPNVTPPRPTTCARLRKSRRSDDPRADTPISALAPVSDTKEDTDGGKAHGGGMRSASPLTHPYRGRNVRGAREPHDGTNDPVMEGTDT